MTSWTIAKQEFKLALRSRWLILMAVLFTLLSVILLFFGGQPVVDGFDGFTRQTASLLNLSLFLMPLLTLLVGGMLIAGEKEDGQLVLYMTYPITERAIIFGKYIGIGLSLLTVLFIGYGTSTIILLFFGTVQWSITILFFLISALLILLFLSIALSIGFFVSGRLQALGMGLLFWAFFVLLYEFIVMALSMVISAKSVLLLLTISVFLNPVELIRVFTILFLGSGTVFGPSIYDFTIWASSWVGATMFGVTALVWILCPLGIAHWILRGGRRI
ncbi:ABC transporter permease [Sporosarcina limicola]|uniref:Cu-processing system permease protein n=1 Tax=Sporosarcina limicola TaxID=34101 RepID=A0A927MMM5_9BACL|nr:ABC transporter permease [Sporosarcina limicola]MBE1555907.1 Cu-processing system permease protein [Sporosarcina limicola]